MSKTLAEKIGNRTASVYRVKHDSSLEDQGEVVVTEQQRTMQAMPHSLSKMMN